MRDGGHQESNEASRGRIGAAEENLGGTGVGEGSDAGRPQHHARVTCQGQRQVWRGTGASLGDKVQWPSWRTWDGLSALEPRSGMDPRQQTLSY